MAAEMQYFPAQKRQMRAQMQYIAVQVSSNAIHSSTKASNAHRYSSTKARNASTNSIHSSAKATNVSKCNTFQHKSDQCGHKCNALKRQIRMRESEELNPGLWLWRKSARNSVFRSVETQNARNSVSRSVETQNTRQEHFGSFLAWVIL